MTQEQALAILKTGANVFVTGEPGSGKTYLVNQYVSWLRERGIEPTITASTGIAATHIGGTTIHSWSGIGVRQTLTPTEFDALASLEYVARRIGRARVLIIDEVSMLSAVALSLVAAVCRHVRRSGEAFGGLQVIFVGDFFQLPPVTRNEASVSGGQSALFTGDESGQNYFAFSSPAWKQANPFTCYLSGQYRQEDPDFLATLAAIRSGEFTAAHEALLAARKVAPASAPRTAPKLYSRNVNVDRINDDMLAALPGELKIFEMESKGREALVGALKKGCMSPETLSLKKGASVMFTKNNSKEGYVNGTLGIVEDFDDESGLPIIITRSGDTIIAEPAEWRIEEGGTVRASITQLPLRLAWAITIHKSQGMSLDEAVMDLSDVFEYGQGYVALSRVRALTGLYLLGVSKRAFQVHPEMIARDGAHRSASEEAQRAFSVMEPKELQEMHDNFIRASGGKVIKAEKEKKSVSKNKTPGGGGAIARLRETYPNAYRPWEKQDDEKLHARFNESVRVGDLAKEFGRKRGAITSRLVKLGLIEA